MKKIGMPWARIPTIAVSGGFDPLHPGHIDMFERAAQIGKLIVIVNRDEFLIRKKGFAFMPLQQRLKVVSSIDCVYAAIPAYDIDDTVCLSLGLLRPDIFANGGDRHKDNTPEAKLCKKLGIKTIFDLGKKICSSSELALNAKNALKAKEAINAKR
jgi:D-beta-D-heptose 7-phosphate kinase/D-beta-D-heptose 1-phosphate adenosyltransferase